MITLREKLYIIRQKILQKVRLAIGGDIDKKGRLLNF